MLLEPPRESQPLHSAVIVLGTDVTLRAVLGNDVGETCGHDEKGQTRSGAPVVVDAVSGVIAVGLKVDVAASLGPVAGQTVAGLVCAESSVGFR